MTIVHIGAARSGTKFLRDVLAAGRGTAAVPYDVNYVWRHGAERAPHDRLDPADLTEAQARFIRRTLPRLARARPDEILIEKTVSNTLRVPYVAAVLPEARFVHLVRDGRDVTESAIRQWQAPPDWRALAAKLRTMPLANLGYATWFAGNLASGLGAGRRGGKVWGPRYPGIEADAQRLSLVEVCALQWRHSVETARADLTRLPADRVFEIRYEELVADESALATLVDDLALPNAAGICAAWRRTVRRPRGCQRRSLAADEQARLAPILTPTLSDLSYAA